MAKIPPLSPTLYDDPEITQKWTGADVKNLDADKQIEIMRHWFFQSYEDPAERTPYQSAEGGYIFIHGGPYEAREVLYEEFSKYIPEEVISQLSEELSLDCWQWTHTEEYEHAAYPEDYYEVDAALDENIPLDAVYYRLENLRRLITSKNSIDADLQKFQRIMIFSSCITSLECFLSDTFIRAVFEKDEYKKRYLSTKQNLRVCLSNLYDFKNVNELQKWADNLIKTELTRTVFHNLKTASKLYKDVLDVDFGDVGKMEKYIHMRHDFVHRFGKNTDGKEVDTNVDELNELINLINEFCRHIQIDLDFEDVSAA